MLRNEGKACEMCTGENILWEPNQWRKRGV